MRFGLFVPQGWRLDLAGIAPADQWETMRGLAQHADAGPWVSPVGLGTVWKWS